MISFQPTEEQTEMLTMLRDFSTRELAPLARDADENKSVPEGLLEHAWELGLVQGVIPEAYGGAGLNRSPMSNALFYEALGEGCAALASSVLSTTGFVNALIDFGSEQQKQQWLPLFCQDQPKVAAVAIQEANALFDPYSMNCQLQWQDGKGLLNGEKHYVPFAESAEAFLILANVANSTGFASIRAIILAKDHDGLSIQENTEGALGLQAIPVATLKFSDCVITEENILGGASAYEHSNIGAALINSIRVGQGALCVGLAKAVTEFAIPYAKEREAFGEPIAKKQAIAFMLADMHTEVESMRWLVWKAASLLDQQNTDRSHGKADCKKLQMETTKATTIAQDYVRRKTMKVADDGLQVFGGHGFIRELPLELWLRHARALTVSEGFVAA